ncbi:hypothetical protein Taro_034226 [Colocasia esculenta]|uniref:Uncharacterized protein n=1 Tax=Colocasia esculenta TaxID=4460 RepID=A0A843VQQ5_COLES|nr:hypothetical protein [Colocasia esculenta]
MVFVLYGGVPISRAVPCVPALADDPSGGFRKGCRACLCLLSLSWLQASCDVSVGGCHTSSLSPGARHLSACPRDRLLPLPGTPSPVRLCQRGLLRAMGVSSNGLRAEGENSGDSGLVWVSVVIEALVRCGPASPSHCLALRWFQSHVGRSGVGPQLDRAVVIPDCCFGNPFLGAVCGGTVGCSSLTSWRVRGAGWFCLWALDLVEV